jgi:hydrogenase-4 component E
MEHVVDTILVFLILSNLMLLGISRLGASVRIMAFQGIALGILPLALEREGLGIRLILFAAILIILKGIVFPWLLNRVLRDVKIQREIEPFVGYGFSVLFGPAALGSCMWFSSRLAFPESVAGTGIISAAFFTIMTGLFLIITRKKALTQVLGYLVLENGIFVFGASLAQRQPLIVELGILLDVFVAVFVMGIAMFHINREFDHIDTDRLTTLRS